MPRNFCKVYDYAGKADLGKGFCYPKTKLEGKHAFSIDNQGTIILVNGLKMPNDVCHFFPN